MVLSRIFIITSTYCGRSLYFIRLRDLHRCRIRGVKWGRGNTIHLCAPLKKIPEVASWRFHLTPAVRRTRGGGYDYCRIQYYGLIKIRR